jgi:hypothetical protein
LDNAQGLDNAVEDTTVDCTTVDVTTDDHPDSNEVVVFHRNGKTEKHRFTKEQMQVLYNLMDYMKSSPEGASQDNDN